MEVTIKDSFDITNRLMSSPYPAGLIVVFEWDDQDELLPVVGEQVSLRHPDGRTLQPKIGEIKCHGAGRSFYFAGLSKSDGPSGAKLSWTPRRVGPRAVDDSGRLIVVHAVPNSVPQ